ncbi:MAG: tetratricopeptide repeat protein [Spirochaetota bacterium]
MARSTLRRRGPAALPIPVVAAIILAGGVLLGGCDISSAHLAVLRGNHAFDQGNYQAATLHYLDHWESSTYDPWIAYNLGNVYHSLGEFDAAVEMWDSAEQAEEGDLAFAVAFNRGVMAYELGRYHQAYSHFREALIINSGSVPAKRNLELALRKIEAGEGVGDREPAEEEQGERTELSSDAVRILEYVRRKEEVQWIAPDQTQQPSTGPDW